MLEIANVNGIQNPAHPFPGLKIDTDYAQMESAHGNNPANAPFLMVVIISHQYASLEGQKNFASNNALPT